MRDTKKLALTGIMAAIGFLLLLAANIVPNSKLFLLFTASLPLSVVIMECDYKYGILYYTATSALALILLPNKLVALPYILVLGLYGLIKAISEKRQSTVVEWIIKVVYFNITLGIYVFIAYQFFFSQIQLPFDLWILWVLANGAFVAYDIIYSLCIAMYQRQIRPKLNVLK